MLQYINGLDYDTRPDYARCKQILTAGLKKLGERDDGKLDFTMKATPAAKVKEKLLCCRLMGLPYCMEYCFRYLVVVLLKYRSSFSSTNYTS